MTLPATAEQQKEPTEMAESAAKWASPVLPPALLAAREKLQERQAELIRLRQSVERGRDDQARKLTAVVDLPKRLEVRSKITVFEARLQELDQEQEQIDMEGESLARQEVDARIEHHVLARRQLRKDGAEIGAKLRAALSVVVGGLFKQWRELQEMDRRHKDTLRGIAEHKMTDSPEFAWTSSVPGGLQSALAEALGECYRAQKAAEERP